MHLRQVIQVLARGKGSFIAADFPKRVVHGGTGKRQLEKTNENVLDFSASTNPFPPRFEWQCNPSYLAYYPDDSYHELKKRIGSVFHRRPEEICVGNGSIELIRVFCQVTLRQGKRFFSGSPTFGEYEFSSLLAGGKPVADPRRADVSFVCNPNNPTGVLLDRQEMTARLSDSASHNGVLFCDEAFIDLSDPSQTLADLRDPDLFVLRSLTKCFSVPGIRFGFGFGDPELIEKVETVRLPWTVNAFAEAFAMEALLHMDDLAASRDAIRSAYAWLAASINELGLQCHPSSVNFILVECGREVAGLCQNLTRHNILVRDCTSFGLPTHIRVAVRTPAENRALVDALSLCMQ